MTYRLAVLFLCLALCTAAAANDAAGVVAKYLPIKAEHVIVRMDGSETVAGLGTPLYAGDSVKVLSGGSLVVAFADGEREELEGPTDFTVPETASMGIMARTFDRLQVLLGRKYRQGSNLATRNPGQCDSDTPPLTAPVLSATTRLTVGHENVALAWLGGCAPYSLEIAGSGDTNIRMTEIKRPLTRVATQQLVTGRYTLMIADAQSRQLEVDLLLAPGLPDGPYPHDNAATELDAVAYAAWLANLEDGGWRLESFQQLRPWIRDGGAMAGTYGDLIMWGDPSLGPDATE